MITKKHPIASPDAYMTDLFSSRIACEGGIVRRRWRDIERYVGRDQFIAELHRRGFRAIENAGHVVIFCNRDPITAIA
ncbi:N-(5'-phosphoribosyl)anthranilate isomerase [Aliishimia ponticola]|uniref:N-(5'-phosphoribosyl)anthranilate isomerase n=1 Tax=Aliishimia ponticola TaxID=2499833 RepID=A0A4S4NIX2_9RHOB|nr:N-(5'-phosphoribosyl)anthranilate isomerase [Aliishimia ponticola]THH38687.1 N-(5'-phosphoribosyl)anthranilate isomerase [Aliishimia ponticola]